MEQANKSRGKYWLIFILSMVGMTLLILFKPEWFWLSLPPAVGSFAMANNLL